MCFGLMVFKYMLPVRFMMICQKKKAKFYISDILIFDNYQLLYTCLKHKKGTLKGAFGAEDGIRTRDFHLGKVTLYH